MARQFFSFLSYYIKTKMGLVLNIAFGIALGFIILLLILWLIAAIFAVFFGDCVNGWFRNGVRTVKQEWFIDH